MRVAHLVLLGLLIGGSSALAQPATSLAEAAQKRFPQPVRVGDLLQRQVLRPRESQPVLGRVREIVRAGDGSLAVVVDYGGVFGWFARPILVPVDAMVLLGQYMEIMDFSPSQLRQFATFDGAGVTRLQPDDFIRVGLAGPSH